MKKIILALVAVGIAFAGTGCSTTGGPNLMQTATLGAGAVGGGLIGNAVGDGDKTAIIAGSVVGAIAANEVGKYMKRSRDQEVAEAYVQGQRDARVESAREFWDERTGANGEFYKGTSKAEASKLRQVQFEGGVVEGVKYGAYYQWDVTQPGPAAITPEP